MMIRPMPTLIGTPQPIFPTTGFFHSRDEDFAWTEFNLHHWNLYITVSGAGLSQGKWGELRLVPDVLVIFPPGLERSYRIERITSGWDFYWMHFSPDDLLRGELDWWQELTMPRQVALPVGADHDHIVADMDEIHRLQMSTKPPPRRAARVQALMQTMLLRVAEDAGSVPRADAAIARVLELMHRNLAAPQDLDRLSQCAGLSRSQFCARFVAATGLSPMAYLEMRRLEWAKFLLRATADGVAEVGVQVGYTDPYHFSRRFSARFGISPRAFRAAQA